MAFYQKYRPQKFSDLIGQDHISKTLLAAIKSGRLSHAFLLTGPRGTGKTTTARLLAKAINCQNLDMAVGEPCDKCDQCLAITAGNALDVIEIDAASHTGVDNIREIIDKARLAPTSSAKKIYIIDEVHMLSKGAFNALLKTLEEPPEHVVFILATTEIHKLPSTIISRTQRYDFKRVGKKDIIKNLKKIAGVEKISIDDGALDIIATAAAGGFRDSVVLFEQVAGFGSKITKEDAENLLGLSFGESTLDLILAIISKEQKTALTIISKLYEQGVDPSQFIREVIEALRKILLYQISGSVLFEETVERTDRIKKLASKTDYKTIKKAINTFIGSGRLLRDVSNPILPLEMAVVELTEGRDSGLRTQDPVKFDKPKEEEIEEIAAPGVYPVFDTGARNDNEKKSGDKKPDVIDNNLAIEQPASPAIDSEVAQARGAGGLNNDDLIPAPVFEMTADLWQKVIEATKKENNSLAALLRDAKPLTVSNEKIVLGVKFKFHKDRISEVKNRQILEKIWNDVTGLKCIIGCELQDGKKVDAKPASDDELQKAVGEVFEVAE